jgi:tetratricopeptide (TPR) repeat protein
MKKTLLTMVLLVASLVTFAQSEEENTNKWIENYQQFQTNKDWNGMISNFDQCIKEVPSWNWAYYYKGFAELNTSDYQGAVNDLSTFITKVDTLAQAYMSRANAYLKLNQANEAIKDYDKYLSMVPNNVDALMGKANAHVMLKDYDNYIKDLTQVIAIDPNNIDAYQNRASVYGMKQDWANAINDYTQIINIKPDAQTYLSRAYANYATQTAESFKNAVADYTKAEELGAKTEQLFTARSVCNKALKNYADEIKDYDNLLALNPEADLYYKRAMANYNSKQYKSAIADLNKFIAKHPKDVNAYILRYTCENQIKDVKAAQADLAKINALQGKPAPKATTGKPAGKK